MWQAQDAPRPQAPNAQKEITPAEYKAAFESSAQEVFSRTQYHWHNLAEDGKTRVPQPYCRDKKPRRPKKGAQKRHGKHEVCKQDFPRKMNLIGPQVICAGLARKYGLKVKGRRNALSLIQTRRDCAWINGTSALLAVVFQSNTDIKPNFRVPLTRETHDKDCDVACLEGKKSHATAVSALHLSAR